VIFQFSNDGTQLLRTFGVPGVAGNDDKHFNRPTSIRTTTSISPRSTTGARRGSRRAPEPIPRCWSGSRYGPPGSARPPQPHSEAGIPKAVSGLAGIMA
jgi:hypothetical protein